LIRGGGGKDTEGEEKKNGQGKTLQTILFVHPEILIAIFYKKSETFGIGYIRKKNSGSQPIFLLILS
jgi:hypothetical protein